MVWNTSLAGQIPSELIGTWDMWEDGYHPDPSTGKPTAEINKDDTHPIRFSYEFRADSTVILSAEIGLEGRGQYIGKVISFAEDSVRIKFHGVVVEGERSRVHLTEEEILEDFDEQLISVGLIDDGRLSIRFLWDNETGLNEELETFLLWKGRQSID